MGVSASRAPSPASDGELRRPLPLPDDPSGRTAVDRDGWPGLAYLIVAVVGCTTLGYGSSYIAEYWPSTVTTLLTVAPPVGMSLGVWLVRNGVANPFIRKFRRWRGRYEDWRYQALQKNREALQSSALLDQVACDLTGENDPVIARQLLREQLEQPRENRRTGRPRYSATGLSPEKRREITRQIRRLRDQGLPWDAIGGRYDISGATARKWCRWLGEEERAGIV